MHGENRKKQIEDLGIRPGDPLLLDRPIERCVAADTFSGAYLDNGLGCFVALEVGSQTELSRNCRKISAACDMGCTCFRLLEHCRRLTWTTFDASLLLHHTKKLDVSGAGFLSKNFARMCSLP